MQRVMGGVGRIAADRRRPVGALRALALTTLAALLLAIAVSTSAHARVLNAGSVLPPGQSGFVPVTGTNSLLNNQTPLYETFRLKPATFDQPGRTETPRPGVTITRDPTYGVPNVRGATARDAWWGVGYAVAQDRLVQLELFRRGTKGTLAEVLADRIDDDIVARRDYYTDAEVTKLVDALPATLRQRLVDYAAGVNAWIAKTKTDPALVPLEIKALALDLSPWTVLDSARIGIQLARSVPSSDGAELRNAAALKAIGASAFAELLPIRTPGQVTTIPREEGTFPSQPGRTRADERTGFRRSRDFLRGLPLPKDATAGTAQATRARGGSNHYAIRTRRGALLSNSPQLGFSIPELFVEYEVHAPGVDVRGVTGPGIPLLASGYNGRVAWGITSGLDDDDDLYAEDLVSRERYRFKGRIRKMSCRDEVFKIAGKPSRTERFCRTVHGPVQARAGSKTAYARRYAIWKRELETFAGLAQINGASTLREAERGVRNLTWNENIVIADSGGNIGWWHPGLLPLKPRRWDERLPFPGDGRAEWRGLLSFRQLPKVVNPRQGWVANWNNMPAVGSTNGDAEALERVSGSLHRAAYLFRRVRRAHRDRTFDALRFVDRTAGTHAQQRMLLGSELRAARSGSSGTARSVLDTIIRWQGNYDTADAAGTVDPGVAAWQVFKDEAQRLALRPLGGAKADPLAGATSRSHQFDATNGQSYALRNLSPAGYRTAARRAASRLAQRFGSADPARWREPRRLYEVSASGLASSPDIKFFDRGTWQGAYELGR